MTQRQLEEERLYRLGQLYVDKGRRHHSDDQFLRWINIPGSGMLNSPGIRPLRFTTELSKFGLPACLILFTHEKTTRQVNPWDDVVDLSNAEIVYWGDAKAHVQKSLGQFPGNRVLRRIDDYILGGSTDLVPPILHFSKPRHGVVKFNGLCALGKLEKTWFVDGGAPVRNYRALLRVLDCEKVHLSWLHSRMGAAEVRLLDSHPQCPAAWRECKRGRLKTIDIWAPRIRAKEDQLPTPKSDDAEVLDQLQALKPLDFERVIVAAFRALPDIMHPSAAPGRRGSGGLIGNVVGADPGDGQASKSVEKVR